MERFVTVNDFPGSTDAIKPFSPHPTEGLDFESGVPEADRQTGSNSLDSLRGHDQGPCLYLGPQGQRCNNPALAGGFCARHRPGGASAASRSIPRVAAAGIGILAAMWPVLADLLRELFRWIHSH
jgi:hypothetical protein